MLPLATVAVTTGIGPPAAKRPVGTFWAEPDDRRQAMTPITAATMTMPATMRHDSERRQRARLDAKRSRSGLVIGGGMSCLRSSIISRVSVRGLI
jgi:hypothetical protein